MKSGLQLILSCLCFFICVVLAAQDKAIDYRFVNFGVKDGLQEKVIYNSAQDKKGYMWFATASGLYRYDGHHFKYWRSPIDKPGKSIANILQGIYCDKTGNLWLGSLTDLQWYNPAKNKFWQPDINKPEIKKITSSYFYAFSEGEKYVWLSTAKNFVYRFSKKDSLFLSLASQYPAGASVTSLKAAEYNGLLYDVHPEGIYIFNNEGRFIRFTAHTPGDITNGNFNETEKCLLLTTYSNGLLKFDITTETLSAIEPGNKDLKKNNLFTAYKDEKGNYFIGAGNAFILNQQKKIFIDFFTTEKSNEFGLEAGKIVNILKDREGNIWFCSHNGLSMLPWQNSQVKTILVSDENTGYTTEPIGAYQEPGTKNLLLINTTSLGLQHVDIGTGRVTTIINPSETQQYEKSITGLIKTPDDAIYVSDGVNTFRYITSSKKLVPYKLIDQLGKPLTEPGRNTCDKKGIIFIGSYNNGFYKWNYNTGKLFHYTKGDVIKTDTAQEDANFSPCITDSRDNIWFTSDNGVFEYRQAEDKFYHYLPAGDADVPVMGVSRFIAEDRKGHFWITTNNNGLYELWFENNKPVWKNYTVNSGIGLPADFCNKIVQSPFDSCLWLNNTAGLIRFDPFEKKVKSIITKQNGLYSHGFGYTFNLFPDKTMVQLFFGAVNIIDFKTYRFNETKPLPVFNSIKVMNKEWLQEAEKNNFTINLSHSQNFLQFEFAALLFNNTNQMQYICKLDNADNDWIYLGQTNSAAYSGLKPGNYTFRVKAANNDGVWGEESVIRINIKKPFYASWWFITMALAFISLLVYWWSRQRVLQAQKEEKLKARYQQQIAETELKALRAQMNPHFIFNSLNSIQKYILKNEHFEASQYLTKFSRLIRLILDHSNQNTVLLSSELEMLKLYIEMESLRFENKFEYAIEIDPGISTDTVEIPSMLIQPFIENAIWHGLLHLPADKEGKEQKGKLFIRFSKAAGNYIDVEIEDNGIGRKKAGELKSKQVLKKKSYGMQITEKRIDAINQVQGINAAATITDMEDNNGNATGTLVKLTIPLTPLNS